MTLAEVRGWLQAWAPTPGVYRLLIAACLLLALAALLCAAAFLSAVALLAASALDLWRDGRAS